MLFCLQKTRGGGVRPSPQAAVHSHQSSPDCWLRSMTGVAATGQATAMHAQAHALPQAATHSFSTGCRTHQAPLPPVRHSPPPPSRHPPLPLHRLPHQSVLPGHQLVIPPTHTPHTHTHTPSLPTGCDTCHAAPQPPVHHPLPPHTHTRTAGLAPASDAESLL